MLSDSKKGEVLAGGDAIVYVVGTRGEAQPGCGLQWAWSCRPLEKNVSTPSQRGVCVGTFSMCALCAPPSLLIVGEMGESTHQMPEHTQKS